MMQTTLLRRSITALAKKYEETLAEESYDGLYAI